MNMNHRSATVRIIACILAIACVHAADSWTTQNGQILRNGAPWCGGGVNSFDQFGPGNFGGRDIRISRVVVDCMRDCPIASSDGVRQTRIGWLHPLEDVVRNNRAQGVVTILAMFGWDDVDNTQILGNFPRRVDWYAQYRDRLQQIARCFAGQPDVWIDPWNEPYTWNDDGFTTAEWLGDWNDIYAAVRAVSPTIVLVPGQSMGTGYGVLVSDDAATFLRGKTNVVAQLHAYWSWTATGQASARQRIAAVRAAGWPLVFGEVGMWDQAAADLEPFLDVTVEQQVPTLAWSWSSGDGLALVDGSGKPTDWGSVFFSYLPSYGSVSQPPQRGPYGGTARTVPGTIQAEDFDEGGEGVAFHDADAGNDGGAYRETAVDVQPTADGFAVGWIAPGEWLEYSIAATAGTYVLQARVAAPVAGGTFHVEIDGVDRSGPMTIPATGAWNAYTTISASGIVVPGGAHVVRVAFDANGANGIVGNLDWIAFVATGRPPGSGTGLTAQYFASPTLSGASLTRTDATVDFDWGTGSPAAGIPADDFSVRWAGQVEARFDETYTFTATSDDGVRLWVDGRLIIDHWIVQYPTESSGTIALTAGRRVDVVMEYYEHTGGATARLAWSSASTPREIVPSTQLYPAASPLASAEVFVSDLPYRVIANGWGPVENDHEVGGSAGGDGGTLSIAGTTFAKGLGAHAVSRIEVPLDGRYSRFRATVGVDDSAGGHGSVLFQVSADGVALASTGVLRGGQAGSDIDVDVIGRTTLVLTASDAGDGITSDHADWALARLMQDAADVGWTTGDIGSVGASGSASASADAWTVTGSGADIWNNADECQFVAQPLHGDGEIVARVASLVDTDPWAKAGVMIRASRAAGSVHAFAAVTSRNGVAFQRRETTGGPSLHTAGALAAAPYWVRLVRVGDALSAYQSADGVAWQPIGTTTIAMGSDVLIGLAVTSHADGTLCTAVFDHVVVVGGPQGSG